MQMQVKAAALITVTFISGCGFVPKKPPAPDQGQRLPINLTAPNPHPWSRTVVNSQVAPRVVTASTTSEQTKPSKPDPISIDTKAGAITEREPIAIWPVLLTYNPDEPISSAMSSSPLTKVSFSWPETEAPIITNEVKTSQPLISDTFVEATALAVDLLEVKGTNNAQEVNPQSSEVEASTENLTVEPALDQPQVTEVDTTIDKKVPLNTDTAQSDTTPTLSEGDDNDSDLKHRDVVEPPSSPALVTWSAQAGMTLSELLANWGAEQNWIVRWTSETDYRIEAPFSIQEPNFLAAATNVFNAYRDAGRTFNVTAYANKVLVVKALTE
ncbi:MAG: hypothetical protein CML17_07690 [Pusillimonas sp.]|nr:hypothetical protein [Pusillimonas sp.]